MLYNKLIANNKIIWKQYINHEIANHLLNETIQSTVFNDYIKQDYLYMIAYEKYAKQLYELTKNMAGYDVFKKLFDNCQNEYELHKQYVSNFDNIQISTPTKNYIAYLDTIFKTGTLAEKIIALAPCCIGYGYLSKYINQQPVNETNRYYPWIMAYHTSDYFTTIDAYINVINALQTANFKQLNQIFQRVITLEIAFFNQLITK